MGADHGSTAIGTLAYQRRPEADSLPVRLAPRPPILAGRDELLTELSTRLQGGSGPQIVALCGLGGAGKTSVAVEYAHRHLAKVAVCWQFPAEDPALLEAEFAVLAAQLGVRDVVDARNPVASVHGVLARQEPGWLLVFDNAPDWTAVERFIPPAGSGQVLITTQNQHWPPGQTVEVPVLSTDTAADFLVNRTRSADRAAARELAEELGGLPLALEQAAAYMQAAGTSLAGYLSVFRTRQTDLLARGKPAGHPASVAATLGLALSRLASQAPSAVGLARLLAFLAPEPVPLVSLLANVRIEERLDGEQTATASLLSGDPVAIADAIAALRYYSLVIPAGDGMIQVHRLVQAVTRAELTAHEASQWQQAAAVIVEWAIPADTEIPNAWPTCAMLLPHARTALELTSRGVSRLAVYLSYSGSYPASRDLFELIANALQNDNSYGPEHGYTLVARIGLATATGQAGNAAGARDQFATLLPLTEQVLGPEHPDTLTARVGLAHWAGQTGDAVGARDQYAALLPLSERVFGAEDSGTLNIRHNFAYYTGEAGDAAGARDQFATLLPLTEQVLGPEHPSTLIVRANFARWTGQAGDAARARDQFAALLVIRERVSGPAHPDTLTTRDQLAYWTRASLGPASCEGG